MQTRNLAGECDDELRRSSWLQGGRAEIIQLQFFFGNCQPRVKLVYRSNISDPKNSDKSKTRMCISDYLVTSHSDCICSWHQCRITARHTVQYASSSWACWNSICVGKTKSQSRKSKPWLDTCFSNRFHCNPL